MYQLELPIRQGNAAAVAAFMLNSSILSYCRHYQIGPASQTHCRCKQLRIGWCRHGRHSFHSNHLRAILKLLLDRVDNRPVIPTTS
jgi:hypothetical protein